MTKDNCDANKSKYENWKSVTESDFVTMFIKTWFTFISVLRELNPSISPFDENGRPKGDNPYMKAYRETIMFSVIKKINIENVKDEFYRLYPLEMKKVLQVFPQYFFQTFFRVNNNFNFQISHDVNEKKGYRGCLKINKLRGQRNKDKYILKARINIFWTFRGKGGNDNIEFEIDISNILEIFGKECVTEKNIEEGLLLRKLYDKVLNEIHNKLTEHKEKIFSNNEWNSTIYNHIEWACNDYIGNLQEKINENYKLPDTIDERLSPNEYVIFGQVPYNLFCKSYNEKIVFSKEMEFYNKQLSTKGIEWFSYNVYALRNALFHEIIDPLDEEWQVIFKSAYLVLKEITDICIDIAKEKNQ